MQTENVQKVTIEDLKRVLETMNFYNQSSGFMAFESNGNRLLFFNSEPTQGGVYVTKQNVINYINEF